MSKPIIPIIFATNNGYSPYASVAINSLVSNASKDYFYDIYIFHTELSLDNIELLESMSGDNFSVKCLCIERFIEREMKYMYTNFHFSKEMFYRILIPSILSQYDRAIYLDCDIVVLGDISEFYNTDIEGNIIGGINDIMHGKSKTYVSNELKMDPFKYINSGVLLIDCKAFRENKIKEKCFDELAVRKSLRYPDQDIINIACKNKIKFLHRKWNYIWHYHIVRDDPSLNLPQEEMNQYLEDAKDIRILHFTSAIKPWKNKNAYLSKHFWNYISGSPYEAQIIKNFKNISSKNYIGYNFLKELDGEVEITSSLYTLEGMNLDDICLNIDGIEQDLKYVNKHVIEIAGKMYDRIFFTFNINPSEIKDRIRIVFYDKRTGLPMTIVSSATFPINFALGDTLDINNKLVYKEKFALICEPKTDEILLERQKVKESTLKSLSKDPVYKKSIILRKIYNLLKPFVKKEIWLISDRTASAGDNGEAFFKYLCKQKPKNIKPIFVIDKSSSDFKRLKKIGKTISPYSKLYKLYYLFASRNISSQLEKAIMTPIHCAKYLNDILSKSKIVFLQHGITKDDISFSYNRCKDDMSLFITAAKKEYDSIISTPAYHCDESIVKLTGFARFDLLEDKKEKIAFIVPTWRKNCIANLGDNTLIDDIENSSYFKFYNELLHNEKLISAAKKNGFKICYYPHPIMRNLTPKFGELDDVFVSAENYTYTDMFCKGAIMLTDYSSTQFDFAYLRKPIIYAHFDKKEFRTSHTYAQGYFSYERDGFGEVVYDLDKTVDTLIGYIESGCGLKPEYLDRIENFYAFNDKNNCKRIYDEIAKLS